MSYTPVQLFSEYDILRSPNKTHNLVFYLKKNHFRSAVLANHNYLFGIPEFLKEAKKFNLKPIIGITISKTDNGEIIFIAKNYKGYQNLIKISSWIAFHKKEVFKIKEHLKKINNLIIVFENKRKKNLSGFENVDVVTRKEIGFLKIDWLKKGDEITASSFSYIKNNKLNFTGISEVSGTYLKPEEYYENIISHKALRNNEKIFANIKYNWPKIHITLPSFPLPEKFTNSKKYLSRLIYIGIKNRFKNKPIPEKYKKRINHETKVIFKLNLDNYFLIIWDIINFSRTHGIQLGPGRGSVVSSLVAYALYITSVDPLKYNLYFERFLNPERIHLPDIDIDIPSNKRPRVINYLQNKYSPKNFSQISTFDTFKEKLAIRESARIFGLNSNSLNIFSKFISNIHLNEVNINKLPQKISNLPHSIKIILLAKNLSGLPRYIGIHAAGIVLSPKKMVDLVPLNIISDHVVTQYDKNGLEESGLVKFDLLRLTNLDILSDIRLSIRKNYHKKIDLDNLNLNDKETINVFKSLKTGGVFQFESKSAKRILRAVKVKNFNDIVIVNALNRPGPSENIAQYVKNKNKPYKISFLDGSLKNILGSTYGVIVYQEQVMQIAQKYAGFSLREADIFRSAIGHKNKKQLLSQHNSFIRGAIRNGHYKKQAEKIFSYIEKFANYGFNKGHAVAYSKLAFQLAFLKSHYPSDFYATLLNFNYDSKYIEEIKNSDQIFLKPPDINHAYKGFTAYKNFIYTGFSRIKGFNREIIPNIIKERKKNGPYTTIINFLERLSNTDLSENDLSLLTYSGAFDKLNYNRNEILSNISTLITGMKFGKALLSTTQISKLPNLNLIKCLDCEKKVLGFTVTEHPVNLWKKEIFRKNYVQIKNLKNNTFVKMLVLIDSVDVVRDRNGNKMAFLKVSDGSGVTNFIVFSRQFIKNSLFLKKGNLIAILGKTQLNLKKVEVIIEKIVLIKKLGI